MLIVGGRGCFGVGISGQAWVAEEVPVGMSMRDPTGDEGREAGWG